MFTPEIIKNFLALSDSREINSFLTNYSTKEQAGLLFCMYKGRELYEANASQMPLISDNPETYLSTLSVDKTEYGEILRAKFTNAQRLYFPKLIQCAENSQFNLQTLF